MKRATQLGMAWVFETAVRVILQKNEGAMEIGLKMESVIESCRFGNLEYGEAVREFKKRYVSQVLIDSAFNQSRAARVLGMHRNTLSRTIAELEIDLDALRLRKPIQSAELLRQVESRSA